MLKAIGRNAALFGALIVGATVSGMAAPLLASGRGAIGPTVLQAESLPRALAAVAIALVVSTGLAVLVARVSNTAVGLFVLGGGLFGLAWRTETVHEIIYDGSLTIVAVETALWSGLLLAATLVLFRAGGPLRDVEPDADGRVPHALRSPDALKSAAAGLLVLPVVWLVAQTPVQGQVIGAVFCGAMVAGLAGRLFAPHVQPVLICASPVLFGAIGHVIGMVTLGGPLRAAEVAGTISPLSLPMPIDYAAGGLLGVAVGLGWARSFLHHEDERPEAERSAAAG